MPVARMRQLVTSGRAETGDSLLVRAAKRQTQTASDLPLRRETSQTVRDAWFADPAGFIADELGAKLWDRQREVAEAVRDWPRVAVRSCNGSGKTFVAAHIVLWWLMCFDDALVITTAPTEHQVRDILWREIRRAYRGHEDLIGGTLLRTELDLHDKHYAHGLSTNTPERFQGFHEGHILFVVDEASGVREGIFEAIEGSMTSEHARLLLIGNPTSLSGYFYEAFHRRRALWRTMHISAFDTPNLKAGAVTHPFLVTPRWVQDAEANWGRDSPMYQIRALGQFPSESEDTLIALRLIEAAVQRWRAGNGGQETASPKQGLEATPEPSRAQMPPGRDAAASERSPEREGVEIGVDVARYGADKTVVCVRRGEDVIAMVAYARQDTMQTAGQVMDFIRRYRPAAVRVDEIGIGAGVLDRLKELGAPGVTGVNVASRSSRPEQFANLRAELFDGLRERFQQGRIAVPDDQDLVSELASLKYSFTSSGQVRMQEKEDLRAKGLPSPDRADALMLAFASAVRSGYRVWTGPERPK